jgi:catechol 2,3-dioxygenase-like lactoylglutathione lyase family enzyme
MTTTETTIGINGMAHVMLTVSQFAAARAFYGRLLPALGMTPVCDTDKLFYCVGARTAIGIWTQSRHAATRSDCSYVQRQTSRRRSRIETISLTTSAGFLVTGSIVTIGVRP